MEVQSALTCSSLAAKCCMQLDSILASMVGHASSVGLCVINPTMKVGGRACDERGLEHGHDGQKLDDLSLL